MRWMSCSSVDKGLIRSPPAGVRPLRQAGNSRGGVRGLPAQPTRGEGAAVAENTTEMRQTVKAVLEGDVRDTTAALHAVRQIAMTFLQAPPQNVAGNRFIAVGEQAMQIPRGDPYRVGNGFGREVRISQVLFDIRPDAH